MKKPRQTKDERDRSDNYLVVLSPLGCFILLPDEDFGAVWLSPLKLFDIELLKRLVLLFVVVCRFIPNCLQSASWSRRSVKRTSWWQYEHLDENNLSSFVVVGGGGGGGGGGGWVLYR